MPGSFEFEMRGLNELTKDLEDLVKEYPDQTEKEVYRLAGQFTKDVNEKFPESYQDGKRPFEKEWHRTRVKAVFSDYTVEIEVENTAPHWHLVENGHQLLIPENPALIASALNGKNKKNQGTKKKKSHKKANMIYAGFVPGKHYCEKTREEWETEFPKRIEKFADKMLKGKNL